MKTSKLLLGDCLETLKTLPANSVDAVVTDPPYGLKFMGKKWDYEVPNVETWREILRVLKPGGHVLSFCGTRTYHRMVVNMEDAGFEIRDQIQWIYGSGFPKSHDVSKAIDKQAGAVREVVGENPNTRGRISKSDGGSDYGGFTQVQNSGVTAPSTDAAKQWQGWGTALKPANEPICLARKPLEGTVASNVLKYGTGGINVDASRIGFKSEADLKSATFGSQPKLRDSSGKGRNSEQHMFQAGENGVNKDVEANALGRFPANVIFDETAAEMLDEQSGPCKVGGVGKLKADGFNPGNEHEGQGGRLVGNHRSDSGSGASRFFYCAKASKGERNAGLEGMPTKVLATSTGQTRPNQPARLGADPHAVQAPVANHHPTVKPIKLMQYLIRMITPPGGVVLDPFMGSGSTGVAAKSLGFEFIGCEMSDEYLEIAKKRIEHEHAEKQRISKGLDEWLKNEITIRTTEEIKADLING